MNLNLWLFATLKKRAPKIYTDVEEMLKREQEALKAYQKEINDYWKIWEL